MTWKERLKKFAPFVGYPVFYVVALVVFATWTFPYDKLRDRIVATFNAEQRKGTGGAELQIKELTSSWLTGVRATDVRLVSPPTEADGKPNELRLDEVKARVSLLPLLVGRTTVAVHAKAFGGEIDADVSNATKERSIDVTFDAVDLGQIGPVTQALGLPMEGKLIGAIKLTMPDGKAAKANGTVSLEARDVAAGDGKAKLKGVPIALPRVNIGNVTINAESKEGVMKVSKIAAGGKDIELAGEGRIQMRELASESMLDLQMRFKVNDVFRTKNENTKALFGAPGSSFPALIDNDPKVKQSKRSDGFYGWQVRGTLGKPDFAPAPAGATLPGAPKIPSFP